MSAWPPAESSLSSAPLCGCVGVWVGQTFALLGNMAKDRWGPKELEHLLEFDLDSFLKVQSMQGLGGLGALGHLS